MKRLFDGADLPDHGWGVGYSEDAARIIYIELSDYSLHPILWFDNPHVFVKWMLWKCDNYDSTFDDELYMKQRTELAKIVFIPAALGTMTWKLQSVKDIQL